MGEVQYDHRLFCRECSLILGQERKVMYIGLLIAFKKTVLARKVFSSQSHDGGIK
jgi:hypothetical protein